jgi:hypothetical protein
MNEIPVVQQPTIKQLQALKDIVIDEFWAEKEKLVPNIHNTRQISSQLIDYINQLTIKWQNFESFWEDYNKHIKNL